MELVEPQVSVIARTYADDDAIADYLHAIGAHEYATKHKFESAEDLIEFAGRICYKSFQPGLNPNVTKVRDNQGAYIRNLLSKFHGSVTEHVTWTFLFENVSRIVTHELARHRVGTATSQESLRYVAFDGHFPVWLPDWARDDPYFMEHAVTLVEQMEQFQDMMAEHFDLHRPGQTFDYKKKITGFLRRFAPAGQATSLVWTANPRTLRHVIEARTSTGAEEEIRTVFSKVAVIMQSESPILFSDFRRNDDGSWTPEWSKV